MPSLFTWPQWHYHVVPWYLTLTDKLAPDIFIIITLFVHNKQVQRTKLWHADRTCKAQWALTVALVRHENTHTHSNISVWVWIFSGSNLIFIDQSRTLCDWCSENIISVQDIAIERRECTHDTLQHANGQYTCVCRTVTMIYCDLSHS